MDCTLGGPKCDAAARDSVNRKAPNVFACFWLERNDAPGSRKIHYAIDENRRGFGVGVSCAISLRCGPGCVALQRIGPGSLETHGVSHCNLFQRRIARASHVVAIHWPITRSS